MNEQKSDKVQMPGMPNEPKYAVTAIFMSEDSADQAVKELQRAGFTTERVQVTQDPPTADAAPQDGGHSDEQESSQVSAEPDHHWRVTVQQHERLEEAHEILTRNGGTFRSG